MQTTEAECGENSQISALKTFCYYTHLHVTVSSVHALRLDYFSLLRDKRQQPVKNNNGEINGTAARRRFLLDDKLDTILQIPRDLGSLHLFVLPNHVIIGNAFKHREIAIQSSFKGHIFCPACHLVTVHCDFVVVVCNLDWLFIVNGVSLKPAFWLVAGALWVIVGLPNHFVIVFVIRFDLDDELERIAFLPRNVGILDLTVHTLDFIIWNVLFKLFQSFRKQTIYVIDLACHFKSIDITDLGVLELNPGNRARKLVFEHALWIAILVIIGSPVGEFLDGNLELLIAIFLLPPDIGIPHCFNNPLSILQDEIFLQRQFKSTVRTLILLNACDLAFVIVNLDLVVIKLNHHLFLSVELILEPTLGVLVGLVLHLNYLEMLVTSHEVTDRQL